jgi:hypothetical protein
MEREQVLKSANEILNGNDEVVKVIVIVKNEDGTEIKAFAKIEEEE